MEAAKHWRWILRGPLLGLALTACVANAGKSTGVITIRTLAPGQSPAVTAREATRTPGPKETATAGPTATPTAPPTGTPTASGTPRPTPTPPTRPAPRALGPGAPGGALTDVEAAVGVPVRNEGRITVATTKGDFVLTMFPERAPKACAKFKDLVGKNFYAGTSFHRVIPGFVAQGGDPLSLSLFPGDAQIGYGTSGEAVPDDEFANGLRHLPGSVALAHSSAANSSSCQFYVCLAALPSLDKGYIVFAQVIAGFDTVSALAATERGGAPTGVDPDRIIGVQAE